MIPLGLQLMTSDDVSLMISLIRSLVRSGLLSKVAHQCGDEASWVFLSIGDAVHAINMVSDDCMLIASLLHAERPRLMDTAVHAPNQLQHAKDFRIAC